MVLLPFLVELEIGSDGFWEAGKSGVHKEQPLGAKETTNNKLNPHMASTPGFEPWPHWWEAGALTSAPPLLFSSLCCPCVRILWPSGVISPEIQALEFWVTPVLNKLK